MGSLFMVLGGICSIASLVCWVIILIAAFQDEIWKGIVGFICGLYLLYFAVAEFDRPNKWAIVGGWLLGGLIGGVFYTMGGGMAAMHAAR